MKVKTDGEVDKEAEGRSQETENQSRDEGPPSGSAEAKGHH